MDLRVFFQKLRKIEQEIVEPHVVVVVMRRRMEDAPGNWRRFHEALQRGSS